ncbi:hypothetical protein [Amycolatopsis sp. TNS106]|uniref:hypothetical protein n=1 Tax=Amycolatopsis sp. TNS106 TaxID=2861750 RepID=UPI001C57B6D0|nr:hypothetical protein [Amycolatopsis sp. TNS106]QXV57399.1 hypothetical protein CVV72_10605 [Amycolatopsis sp. TNS106]
MTVGPANTESADDASGHAVTFDLMICHDDQILFHDHYESREARLSVCLGILTGTHLVSGILGPSGEAAIRDIHDARLTLADSSPDAIVRDIADVCRQSDVRIYTRTKTRTPTAPTRLYSVVTQYRPNHVTAEHFTTRTARHESLLERVSHLHAGAGAPTESALPEEESLAVLLEALLAPARISLTESVLDATDGVYKPILGSHDVDQQDR